MHLAGGKLARLPTEVNSVGGLIFLHDKVTDVPFLVDTSASVSVLPHCSNSTPTGPVLTGADGKNIASWGDVTKKLCFGVQYFLCSFLLAAVSKPILGMDFLAAHRLLVDPFSGTVLNTAELTPIGSAVCTVSKKFIAAVGQIAPAVRELLAAPQHRGGWEEYATTHPCSSTFCRDNSFCKSQEIGS